MVSEKVNMPIQPALKTAGYCEALGERLAERVWLEGTMLKFISRFARNESGATAVEYGLIAALIGVVIIAGASALGVALNTQFSGIGASVTSAGS